MAVILSLLSLSLSILNFNFYSRETSTTTELLYIGVMVIGWLVFLWTISYIIRKCKQKD